MSSMSLRNAYFEAVEHLPNGATLLIHEVSWDDYERLLDEVSDRPGLRIAYDAGELEIMSPFSEHEQCARFVDALVCVLAEECLMQEIAPNLQPS